MRLDDWRVDDMILEEVFRNVKLRENGRLVEMPVLRAAVRTMAIQAANGNVRSARTLLHAVFDVMGRRKKLNDAYRETVVEYINEANAEIAERKARNQPIDHISPHPEDVLWDEEMALPYFPDPATQPSLEENRQMLATFDTLKENLEKLQAEASSAEEVAELRSLFANLMENRKLLESKIKRQESQQEQEKRTGKS
ncbi:MAG: hypothetical protein IOC86_07440 [Aestuariivirga sp.]|nr:hypothetical protein [Aestuariivirga sp.]